MIILKSNTIDPSTSHTEGDPSRVISSYLKRAVAGFLPDGKNISHDELLSYYLERTENSIQHNIDEES